jgi:hypothetical protein
LFRCKYGSLKIPLFMMRERANPNEVEGHA